MTDNEFNEQEQDRFEARFFGALPEAEAAAFDAELARDAALKERYALFVLSVRGIQSSRKALKDTKAETLRERMRAIDAELDAHPTVVRSIVRPWVGWAAAAAVLITIAGAWWFMQGETPQQLAEEYAIAEPGLPVLMGTSPRAMDAIMNAYKRQDLGTAMQLLERGLALDPANDTLNYFKGVIAERTDPGSAMHAFRPCRCSGCAWTTAWHWWNCGRAASEVPGNCFPGWRHPPMFSLRSAPGICWTG